MEKPYYNSIPYLEYGGSNILQESGSWIMGSGSDLPK